MRHLAQRSDGYVCYVVIGLVPQYRARYDDMKLRMVSRRALLLLNTKHAEDRTL